MDFVFWRMEELTFWPLSTSFYFSFYHWHVRHMNFTNCLLDSSSKFKWVHTLILQCCSVDPWFISCEWVINCFWAVVVPASTLQTIAHILENKYTQYTHTILYLVKAHWSSSCQTTLQRTRALLCPRRKCICNRGRAKMTGCCKKNKKRKDNSVSWNYIALCCCLQSITTSWWWAGTFSSLCQWLALPLSSFCHTVNWLQVFICLLGEVIKVE